MNIPEQIKKYIDSHPEPKRADIETLHQRIMQAMPKCKLWFLVENPAALTPSRHDNLAVNSSGGRGHYAWIFHLMLMQHYFLPGLISCELKMAINGADSKPFW